MSILAIMATQAKVVMLPRYYCYWRILWGSPTSTMARGHSSHRFGNVFWASSRQSWAYCSGPNTRNVSEEDCTTSTLWPPTVWKLLVSSPIAAFIDWLKSCAQWACNQFDYPGLICGLRSGDARIPGTIALAVLFIVVTMIFTSSSTPLSSASSATKNAEPGADAPSDLPRAARLAINTVCSSLRWAFWQPLCLSMYIIWTPIGAYGLLGVQARYLLPCLYALAILVPPKPFRASDTLIRGLCTAQRSSCSAYLLRSYCISVIQPGVSAPDGTIGKRYRTKSVQHASHRVR